MPSRRQQDRSRATQVDDLSATRLAELVTELTGTEPGAALHAVRSQRRAGRRRDALEVVASAMVDVDQPPPDGFRLAGFLRADESGGPPVDDAAGGDPDAGAGPAGAGPAGP